MEATIIMTGLHILSTNQEIALAGSHYRGHYLRVEVRYIEDF